MTQDAMSMQWVLDEARIAGVDVHNPQSPKLRAKAVTAHRLLEEGSASMQHPGGVEGVGMGHSTELACGSPNGGPAAFTLPDGWSSAVDPASGQTYYWRNDNPAGTTTWECP